MPHAVTLLVATAAPATVDLREMGFPAPVRLVLYTQTPPFHKEKGLKLLVVPSQLFQFLNKPVITSL